MKFLLLLLMPAFVFCQTDYKSIPKKTNEIVVHGISLLELANALLDAGYQIEKKDNDLGTASTNFVNIKTRKGGHSLIYLFIRVRVRDSIAVVQGDWFSTMFGETVEKHESCQIANGSTPVERLAFGNLNEFALSLKKPIEYRSR